MATSCIKEYDICSSPQNLLDGTTPSYHRCHPTNLTTFHNFSKLPTELRFTIWEYTYKPEWVVVSWCRKRRAFVSSRKPPAILHCNRESRIHGKKTYQLCLASSPEFARVYFSYDLDGVVFRWKTLGPAPGRIGRKLSDVEAAKIQTMAIEYWNGISHARDNFREWKRFSSLKLFAPHRFVSGSHTNKFASASHPLGSVPEDPRVLGKVLLLSAQLAH